LTPRSFVRAPEDIYGSEHSARVAYQDCWEILRDPSHVRTLPLSELLHILRDAGLETKTVSTADDLCPEVERWMTTKKVSESERQKYAKCWKMIYDMI